MVFSKASLVTSLQMSDVENNKMDKLGAASERDWMEGMESWRGFEFVYFIWLSLQLGVFHLILTQIMMPEICDHCRVHPYGPVDQIVLLVIYIFVCDIRGIVSYRRTLPKERRDDKL